MKYVLQSSSNRYLGKNRRGRLDIVFNKLSAITFDTPAEATTFLRKKVTNKLKNVKWVPCAITPISSVDLEVQEEPADSIHASVTVQATANNVCFSTDKSSYVAANIMRSVEQQVDTEKVLEALNFLREEFLKLDTTKAELQAVVSACDRAICDIVHSLEATDSAESDQMIGDIIYAQQIRALRKQRRKAKNLLLLHSELAKAVPPDVRSNKVQRAIDEIQPTSSSIIYNTRIMNYGALYGEHKIMTRDELLARLLCKPQSLEVDEPHES